MQARLNMNRLQRAADAARQTTIGGITSAASGLAEIAGGIDWEGRKENRTAKRAEKAADRAAKAAAETAVRTKEDIKEQFVQQSMSPGGPISDYEQGLASEIRPRFSITPENPDAAAATTLRNSLSPGGAITSSFLKAPRTLDDIADYASKVTKPRMGLKSFYDMSQLDAQTPKIQQQEEELNALLNQPMSEGGELDREVEETPGDFDHDENPIDIVQEGAKIGEMTGGEYIFNPEQAEEMKKLSEEGDSELHQFIRKLLSKEQFQ